MIEPDLACRCARCDSQAPAATSGRANRSPAAGNSSVMPNTASSAMAAMRPYWFASTAQSPLTTASVATPEKVSAIPTSNGSPLRTKG